MKSWLSMLKLVVLHSVRSRIPVYVFHIFLYYLHIPITPRGVLIEPDTYWHTVDINITLSDVSTRAGITGASTGFTRTRTFQNSHISLSYPNTRAHVPSRYHHCLRSTLNYDWAGIPSIWNGGCKAQLSWKLLDHRSWLVDAGPNVLVIANLKVVPQEMLLM